MENVRDSGQEMYQLVRELFPLCRSLTGPGVRDTLSILKQQLPIATLNFPTGTKCFDWEIPEEWDIQGAYVTDSAANTILDFADQNLHVLGYSEPVSGWFSLSELREHIFTLPDRPRAIPYLTSYYRRRWGLCMRHEDAAKLTEGKYYVDIRSRLFPGNLTLAEAFLPGQVDQEILLSCYICHPSMANDSLSGVAVTTHLYHELAKKQRHYSYRFLFVPETIGAIAYLSRHGDALRSRIQAGFVLTCCGDSGMFNYKRSRRGNHAVDRVSENVLRFSGRGYRIRDFWPLGSDERQYCSPGFNLPVGSLMRSVYGEFPEYHTSDDDLSFVSPRALGETLELYLTILVSLEGNRIYRNLVPLCEPQLGKRELYPLLGGQKARDAEISRRMWILNYSDGEHALIDIAELMNTSILDLIRTAKALQKAGLLEDIRDGNSK